MEIEVAYATPAQQWVIVLQMEPPATVSDALAAVSQQQPFANLNLADMAVGVFGEVVQRDQVLQPYDRVELYRPLHQDPKAARRARAQRNHTS